MTELDPNHPVLREAHDHWHKLVAILMLKFGVTEVEITIPDILKLEGVAVCLDERGSKKTGKMHLRLMTEAEGEKLAIEAGGLPEGSNRV